LNHTARLLLRQFTDPIVLILFGATIVSMVVGDVTDGVIILAIIVPSGLLSFWQEHRAGETMKALIARVQVHVEVMRGGVEVTVPLEEVVVGDEVLLRVGDVVPGDMQIAESKGLQLDESALTGESFAAERAVGELARFGTHVVAGQGRGVVSAIGEATQFGALEKSLAGKDIKTGFEKGMTRFGLLLMRAMIFLLVGLLVVNIALHRPLLESLLFSIALAVGLTPQLLPAIIAVSLAAGAKMMASRQVLVKRLDAIEDFGAMNVLCTDKTGTITAGVVSLDGALALQSGVSAFGSGVGRPSVGGASVGGSGEVWAASSRVLRLAFLNASLQQGFKNPLDEAIVAAAGAGVFGAGAFGAEAAGAGAAGATQTPGIARGEIAYDFERKRLSVLVEADGVTQLITKGAFTSVLGVCAMTAAEREAAQAEFERLSAEGNRVLAIASKALSAMRTTAAGVAATANTYDNLTSADESDLTFEGLLVFLDPPKPGAAEAIAELAGLGIDLYLITGDNPLAAKAIAGKVGLPNEKIMTGEQIKALGEASLIRAIDGCRVFAEVEPIQKERIVAALRAAGNTVGYFGDGINDSAALKTADVGISVDTAVDVAKNAAAIVLLAKDLSVVAEGVRLGRRTFVNTMKYVRVGVSAAFGNMLSMAIAAVFLPFLPLLPVQILLLNFMTDFPALAISSDSVDDEDIAKPHAWDIKKIRNFMILFGLISSVFDIITFLVLRLGFNAGAELFRSGWFVESTFTELVVMLVLRTRKRFWRSAPGKALWISSAVLGALVIAIPFTFVGKFLQLAPLPLPLLAVLAGLIAIYAAINELAKKRAAL
jgi:Mg2+-importing ATPase